jgi:signal transduction histidine kinase
MDLARLESPEMKIDREPFPLSEAVAIVYRRFEMTAAAKSVSLLVPMGLEACPPLDADPAMVERLLGNLVQNAIEHTPPGGTVRVDARLAGMWAEIQVTDTGPGIPPDQVTHVFERFYRGPSSAGTVKSGLGLGLAIAKRIVELHGGEIRARSPPVRGASFRFTLPLVRESSEQISFPARAENRSTASSHERERG